MFKPVLFSALLFVIQTLSASAMQLIAVTKNSGYVAPEYSYSMNCGVGTPYTKMRIRLGESRTIVRTVQTRYTALVPNAQTAMNLISVAANGSFVTYGGRTDGPTSSYYGLLGSRRVLLLLDESFRVTRNTAPPVQALLDFANLNCPTPR
jgi:hypothetical protein